MKCFLQGISARGTDRIRGNVTSTVRQEEEEGGDMINIACAGRL